MRPNLLILGGTSEASALARRLAPLVARAALRATLSYAGRVVRPAAQPLPVRIGGFGGAEGLAAYLRAERVTHLVDATHPFAARMSANAVAGAAAAGVPLIALTRPEWVAGPGDRWIRAASVEAAAEMLAEGPLAAPARAVFLATGRQQLAAFAAAGQHRYLVRVVDPPEGPVPLPRCEVVLARGPFDAAGDTALMRAHGIETVVAKNAGGIAAVAKLAAARALGLPVIMIDRPALPERAEAATPEAVLAWLGHAPTDLGV
ncbi:MAG: cobalt-precorrin-6A reductase [Pseudomonadota bacterium]